MKHDYTAFAKNMKDAWDRTFAKNVKDAYDRISTGRANINDIRKEIGLEPIDDEGFNEYIIKERKRPPMTTIKVEEIGEEKMEKNIIQILEEQASQLAERNKNIGDIEQIRRNTETIISAASVIIMAEDKNFKSST